jgi:hypothetical protein
MRKITVNVANRELNALEDLLFCKLEKRAYKRAHRESNRLWHKLVRAWDKPKGDK